MNKKIYLISLRVYILWVQKISLRLYFEIVRLLERIIPQKYFFLYSSNGNVPNLSTNIDKFIEKNFPFRKK